MFYSLNVVKNDILLTKLHFIDNEMINRSVNIYEILKKSQFSAKKSYPGFG